MARAWRTIIYALVIGVALVVGLTFKAWAHDHSRPELDQWYRTLIGGHLV